MTIAELILPALGNDVIEGTIVQWLKSLGDPVAAGEPLLEVSTDKVDTEIPADASGILVRIDAPNGTTVSIGSVLGAIDTVSDPYPAEAENAAAGPPVPVATPVPSARPAAPTSPVVPGRTADAKRAGAGHLLSPAVRDALSRHQLTADAVSGTGIGGRILPRDVETHVAQHEAVALPGPRASSMARSEPSQPARPPTVSLSEHDRIIELSHLRTTIGKRTTSSQSNIPHALSSVEVDYGNVDAFRVPLRDNWREAEGFALTYLPFVVRALVDALSTFPHLNASVAGEQLVVRGAVNIGIAVDMDYEGLVVPVIHGAADLRLRAIAQTIERLARDARSGTLRPDDTAGGTFTITNNGSAGSMFSAPIINEPQVAILSTDAVRLRPSVVATESGPALGVRPIGNLVLAWDHRAFDGAYAAQFLVAIRDTLQTRNWSNEL